MDQHQPDLATPSRDPPLYVTEAEIARRLGISPRKWAEAARTLGRQGLPPQEYLFGKRYWPAVKAFLDRRYGLAQHDLPIDPDGEENPDVLR